MDQEAYENMVNILSTGKRQDGRQFEEFRNIEIKLDVVEMAEGSAWVKVGDTEVIAGVKLKIEKPFPDTPEEGILMVNTELTPLSNPNFESGPPSTESIEVSRVIDRGLREGHAIDVKKLCIEKGEKVWVVNVDVCPINTDGNLLDIGSLAALIALYNTRLPEINEDGQLNYKKKTDKKLPIIEDPIPVTVYKIGDNFIVDPTENEQLVYDARLTINFISNGNICAMQKGGNGPLKTEEIKKMIEIAEKISLQNRKILNEIKK
jgi:exosome complex component RRP42